MLIDFELNELNSRIIDALEDDKNLISPEIKDYLTAKSKKLRPSFVFLFSKALGLEISDKIYNIACAVELIHNSTLIHDDIIDNSETRRGKMSLNFKLGNSLSVLAGDILLSVALKQLSKCNQIEIIKIFSDSLYNMCRGEINQNFSLGKIPVFDEYIKKSEYKTAELFKAPLISLSYLENLQNKEDVASFALNFGIAFQIKDDLLNILNFDNSKPLLSDIHNGIYTAPVIFLNEDNKIDNLDEKQIISYVQNTKYIQKTTDLIKQYAENAINAINFIPNNQYKDEIVQITSSLYKAGINE